jgi:hypothetical protein
VNRNKLYLTAVLVLVGLIVAPLAESVNSSQNVNLAEGSPLPAPVPKAVFVAEGSPLPAPVPHKLFISS